MKSSQCITNFYNYQRMNVKKNTLRNYEFVLNNIHALPGITNHERTGQHVVLSYKLPKTFR
jgi:hypothetical protein